MMLYIEGTPLALGFLYLFVITTKFKVNRLFPSRHSQIGPFFIGMLLFSLFLPGTAVATGPTSDQFITGYATAVLKRDFHISAELLQVQYGVIYIQGLEASTQ